MSTDSVNGADGVTVDKDPQVEALRERLRAAVLQDDLKAARQRVKDAEKALAALEKEAQK